MFRSGKVQEGIKQELCSVAVRARGKLVGTLFRTVPFQGEGGH